MKRSICGIYDFHALSVPQNLHNISNRILGHDLIGEFKVFSIYTAWKCTVFYQNHEILKILKIILKFHLTDSKIVFSQKHKNLSKMMFFENFKFFLTFFLELIYFISLKDGCKPCSCNTELSRGLGCNPVTG